MTNTLKFNAAILSEIGKSLAIVRVKRPRLKAGQVFVKIRYAGICHSQLMEAQGKRGEDKYLPHMMGHEGVGEVVEIGPGVEKVKLGDDVIIGWIKSSGIDAGGSLYESELGCQINAGPSTTFSEYAVISENRLVIKPANFNDQVAVLFGCALPTGAGMVLNQLKPKRGSTVVVLGLGGIGLSALLALHYFDVENIIAIDIEPKKLAIAKRLGATHTFLATEEGIASFNRLFVDGVDYAIESAGLCSTIELAFSLINNKGTCLFASHPCTGEKISIDPHQLISGKKLQGSWGGSSQPDRDIPIIADIIESLNLPVDILISDVYPLEDINQALADLNGRNIVRALIDMGNN